MSGGFGQECLDASEAGYEWCAEHEQYEEPNLEHEAIGQESAARVFKDPSTYAGEPVCPCCGSGWPCCADRGPHGETWTHSESCALYVWADDVCADCAKQFAIEAYVASTLPKRQPA